MYATFFYIKVFLIWITLSFTLNCKSKLREVTLTTTLLKFEFFNRNTRYELIRKINNLTALRVEWNIHINLEYQFTQLTRLPISSRYDILLKGQRKWALITYINVSTLGWLLFTNQVDFIQHHEFLSS